MFKCSHKDCKNQAIHNAGLYGKNYPVCSEHFQITDLGNWEEIQSQLVTQSFGGKNF